MVVKLEHIDLIKSSLLFNIFFEILRGGHALPQAKSGKFNKVGWIGYPYCKVILVKLYFDHFEPDKYYRIDMRRARYRKKSDTKIYVLRIFELPDSEAENIKQEQRDRGIKALESFIKDAFYSFKYQFLLNPDTISRFNRFCRWYNLTELIFSKA